MLSRGWPLVLEFPPIPLCGVCLQHFPHVKSYVRAHDVEHGKMLEKAGATAVVPETLEPSLQVSPKPYFVVLEEYRVYLS